MNKVNFYTVIIGTELLNGRREDSHFSFVNTELIKRGWEQKASFIIDDDPQFMSNIYNLIKNDPNSVMFSFGGIGSTPDDHTRDISALTFTGKESEYNSEALSMIEERFKERFKEDAEFRLNQSGRLMAKIPVGSKLVDNPYNKIPGYSLEDRFFFLPGFPEMSHPMVANILDGYFPKGEKKFRETLKVFAGEGVLIDIMNEIPEIVETSSLPSVTGTTIFSLSSFDKNALDKWVEFSKKQLEKLNIEIGIGE